MGGVRFKRVADAFDMAASRDYNCSESSGSERESSLPVESLSDLVNSFLQRDASCSTGQDIIKHEEIINDEDDDDFAENNNNNTSLDLLRGYLEHDHLNSQIHAHVESAIPDLHLDPSSPDFKRRLMTTLRQAGFDAGLCKSKWSKTVNCPAGNYEYIDVNVSGGRRYIVEVNITSEFQVARSTERYNSLLQALPQIYVGNSETLKQIIKLMCRGIKKCMRKYEMHVPPWRRYAYMQSKWFSSNYKRTTNQVSVKKSLEPTDDKLITKKMAVGFVTMQGKGNNGAYFCREQSGYVSKAAAGSRVGNLALAMNANGFLH